MKSKSRGSNNNKIGQYEKEIYIMVTPNGDFCDSFDCEIQYEEYYQEDLAEP